MTIIHRQRGKCMTWPNHREASRQLTPRGPRGPRRPAEIERSTEKPIKLAFDCYKCEYRTAFPYSGKELVDINYKMCHLLLLCCFCLEQMTAIIACCLAAH